MPFHCHGNQLELHRPPFNQSPARIFALPPRTNQRRAVTPGQALKRKCARTRPCFVLPSARPGTGTCGSGSAQRVRVSGTRGRGKQFARAYPTRGFIYTWRSSFMSCASSSQRLLIIICNNNNNNNKDLKQQNDLTT